MGKKGRGQEPMAKDANDKDGLRSAGRVFATIGVIGFAVLALLVATTFVGGVSRGFGPQPAYQGWNSIIYVYALMAIIVAVAVFAIGGSMIHIARIRSDEAAGKADPPLDVPAVDMRNGAAAFLLTVSASSLFCVGFAAAAAVSLALTTPSTIGRIPATWGPSIAVTLAALLAGGAGLYRLGWCLSAARPRALNPWQFIGNIAYYLGPVWTVFSGLYASGATMIGDDAPKHMGSPLVFGLTAAAIGASIHLSGRWLRACPKPTST